MPQCPRMLLCSVAIMAMIFGSKGGASSRYFLLHTLLESPCLPFRLTFVNLFGSSAAPLILLSAMLPFSVPAWAGIPKMPSPGDPAPTSVEVGLQGSPACPRLAAKSVGTAAGRSTSFDFERVIAFSEILRSFFGTGPCSLLKASATACFAPAPST